MFDIKDITDEYLNSFPQVSRTDQAEQLEKEKEIQERITKGKMSQEDVLLPSSREVSKTMLNTVLSKSGLLQDALAKEKDSVLTKAAWRDFTLLSGNVGSSGDSVLNKIKRTRTHAGSCVMATEMVNPKTDKEVLVNQQKGLQTLQENSNVKKALEDEMAGIAVGEKVRTLLWREESEVNSVMFQTRLGGFYFSWFSFFNRSPVALRTKKIIWDWFRQLFLLLFFVAIVPGYLYWYFYHSDLPFSRASWFAMDTNPLRFILSVEELGGLFEALLDWFVWILLPFFYPFFRGTHWFSEIEKGDVVSGFDMLINAEDITSQIIGFASNIVNSLLLVFLWWFCIRNIIHRRATINFLTFHLAAFQDLVRHAHRISQLVAKNPALEAAFGHQLVKTRALLQMKNGDVGRLMRYLKTTRLRNRSYFFNSTGQLLVTYDLLDDYKDVLADLIYEMGLLDMRLGIVKLMAEHQEGTINPITFGTFEEAPDNRPRLHATGVWHCFLDAADAVPNDVMMDFDHAFFIITGPNAGGKSTYILSIGVNTILNQVFGIVYAKQFTQTIFYKIISYVNVTQDLAKGLSLAEAGMEVLRAHKEILSKVTQPILAIVDEILNGVDPRMAKEYSYKILKKRSPAYLNCLTLVTTHLMNLTELAKEDKRFHNKKVVVKIPGQNGRPFDYTYQIHDGVTEQNVVEVMLKAKGIV